MGDSFKARINGLNYTFQLYVTEINSKLATLKREDKYYVTLWKNKFQESNASLEECEVRNEFALLLSQQINSGALQKPFTERPPIRTLLETRELINVPLPSGKKIDDLKKANVKKGKRAELNDKEFIVGPNPVAKCGAFCYLAVLSRTEESDD